MVFGLDSEYYSWITSVFVGHSIVCPKIISTLNVKSMESRESRWKQCKLGDDPVSRPISRLPSLDQRYQRYPVQHLKSFTLLIYNDASQPPSFRRHNLFSNRPTFVMGAIWSSENPSSSGASDLEQPPEPESPNYPRCYGDVVPSVCSNRPEDCYDELYQKMYYVQHTNHQDCIVAFQACEKDNPRVEPEEWFELVERIPRVYEYLAHRNADTSIITLDVNVDVDTPIDVHPRIVK